MKIPDATQIRELDKYTIEHEPVSSVDLMERAATACFRRIVRIIEPDARVIVVCGKGNNGGDGLVISRLLNEANFACTTLVIEDGHEFTPDAKTNYDRLARRFSKHIVHVGAPDQLDYRKGKDKITVIDALFGTGLARPVDGLAAEVIRFINAGFRRVISIDVPSGLYCDKRSAAKNIVQSTVTLTFQMPKLAFLVPDNAQYVPAFELIDIGLHPAGMEKLATKNLYIVAQFVSTLMKMRPKFSHKGMFGHALLAAGSRGKTGAAVIAAKACLRSGAGLLTVHSTSDTVSALAVALPEAMSSRDENDAHIASIDRLDEYSAVGFGPGVGDDEETATVLKKILQFHPGPLVIDADGLNILAQNKTWLSFLPPDTILTPHPGEFTRLVGKIDDGFDRIDALREFSLKHQCIVVLKGAHTAIAMPDGNIAFNSTGNACLAKAGTGDGLTGIILGLLARGYSPPQAAIIGTFVHGFAADRLIEKRSMESILISDVIDELPKAFAKLEDR